MTGIIQFDFDYKSIQDYDIDELKQMVFSLPFIGLCSLSVSGKGFYALAVIQEPEKLKQYAEHCFEIFTSYGIEPDTTKGRNPQDLRYVSYDANMLYRENPEPLRIIRFKKPTTKKNPSSALRPFNSSNGNGYLKSGLAELQTVEVGNRWGTVQKVAYTLGGYGRPDYLDAIIHAIKSNPAFYGQEEKYFTCARDCFNAGAELPLKNTKQ